MVPPSPAGAILEAENAPMVVTPGTHTAVKVAQAHIEEVTERFSFNGSRLDLRSVLSAKDVADSETLWEAACLWKQ
eukprot:scaffold159080_cov50-Prasinocladus_malaysianus.AAC.1